MSYAVARPREQRSDRRTLGHHQEWWDDGKDLYYLAPDGKVMVGEFFTSPVFQVGRPKLLFQALSGAIDMTTLGGKRFLFEVPVEQSMQSPFTVALNWQAG
jgi:hypothetical protein